MNEKLESRYYEGINQIYEVFSSASANELLSQGFELLKIDTVTALSSLSKDATEVRKLVYVLGKKGQPAKTAPKEEIRIPELEWHDKEGNEAFSWAWVGNRDGSVTKESAALRDLLKERKEIEQDGFTYRLSPDQRFFNRIKHGEKN